MLDHLGLADISLTLAPLNNPGKSSIQAPTRSDRVAEELLRENLLVVGGPVPNTVARFLLGRPEVAYNFQSIEGGNLSYDIICQRDRPEMGGPQSRAPHYEV